ncbi:3-phosphoshikimate 1-carboxyvinyltransferase [Pseudokineococcus marinus]|uniref:3-phosphoshikimate 1-carboxyvinyltransferase n=1 Tax=Pseudokineococcus marinus TaxID=351215 RepID=A0A849BX90_9ACTN|nr:3-phosphoshikimate 1-carboxyvinyltransferase [Pseudokineococcus marinus]NNH22138.1 3-phosphoshikimate 1-carboxyvinyltransferase [Pseudokineococcus marinus]
MELSRWPAPTAPGPVDAVVSLPGSKSLTNRYLVVAALADRPSRLRSPLVSRDTRLMAGALEALGARVREVEGATGPGSVDWVVEPAERLRGGAVDVGLAGTVMRFVPPLAALADGDVRLDGDPRARERPMAPVVDALRALGVDVEDAPGGALPMVVHGRGAVRGGAVTIDAGASSQFVSGLLLAAPRYAEGLVVRHAGPPLPSQPHVAMTVETLRDVGVDVDDSEPDTWAVRPGPVAALDVQVEPDLSSAAPFLAAAAVTGGRVRVLGWPQHTTQAGDALRDLLDEMGAEVSLDREGLVVRGGELFGVDVDLHEAGELVPVVVALAALASTPTRVRGVAHLRGHETDRLAALVREVERLGGRAEETEDGLVVRPRPLHGDLVRTYADHRIAQAAAVLGLRVPGVVVEDVETTAKTLPGFVDLWTGMLDGAGPGGAGATASGAAAR